MSKKFDIDAPTFQFSLSSCVFESTFATALANFWRLVAANHIPNSSVNNEATVDGMRFGALVLWIKRWGTYCGG